MDIWLFLGLQAVALIGGLITGALALTVGGLGGLRTLRARQDELEASMERTDTRITREVKTRASDAARKVRTDAEVAQEAMQHLGGARDPPTPTRPSVAHLGR